MNARDRIAELFRTATPATSAAALREAERLAESLKTDDPARGYVEGLRMLATLPRRGAPPAPAAPPPPRAK